MCNGSDELRFAVNWASIREARVRITSRPEAFSGFVFAIAQNCSILARIISLLLFQKYPDLSLKPEATE